MIIFNPRVYSMISVVSCAVMAGLLVFFSTPNGLATSPDSVAYLKGAAGFFYGHGFDFISAEWPPLYPVLLIVTSGLFQENIILGSRVLQSSLFAMNFCLIALIFYRIFKITTIISIFLAILICIQPAFIVIHFYAWSEPTLVFFILCNFLTLESRSKSNSQARKNLLEIILVILATGAFLTRFAGICVAVLNAAMIFYLERERKSILSCALRSTWQLIGPILFFLPWVGHTAVGNSATTERTVSFHLISVNAIRNGFATIGKWLMPFSLGLHAESLRNIRSVFGFVVICLSGLSTFVIIVRAVYKKDFLAKWLPISSSPSLLIQTLILFNGIYLYFIVAAISFVDNKVVLDDRILAPMYLCIALIIVGLIGRTATLVGRIGALVILIMILANSYPNLRSWLLINYFNGAELSDKSLRDKGIRRFAEMCDRNARVYADNPWHFDLIFRSKVIWLPNRILFNTGRVNENYDSEVQSLQFEAALIIVESKKSEIARYLESQPIFDKVYDGADGTIWKNKKMDKFICE